MSLKEQDKYEEQRQEYREEKDYELHLQAGLSPAGIEMYEQQWLGTDQEWDEYTRLFKLTFKK
jgi:hypothetical protein